MLGQVKTEEKSNEITAIPELLDMIFIEGCIVTTDALGRKWVHAFTVIDIASTVDNSILKLLSYSVYRDRARSEHITVF